MEISLPDEKGRYQILQIHSARMYENRKIAGDVNLKVSKFSERRGTLLRSWIKRTV